jgi:hypothetical protein
MTNIIFKIDVIETKQLCISGLSFFFGREFKEEIHNKTTILQ